METPFSLLAGAVVSLTVLVYDYCLTFNREVRLVWKSNWGIGNITFLLARYPTFVDVPLAVWLHRHPYSSPGKCLAIYTTTTWFTVFGIAMADGILYLRTYALYHGDKKFLVFLILLYVACFPLLPHWIFRAAVILGCGHYCYRHCSNFRALDAIW